MTEMKKTGPGDELLDDGLKKILGNRYSDESHLFTPEAQQERRNNRTLFTIRITAFLLAILAFISWAADIGIMSLRLWFIGVCACTVTIGFYAGVCVSHNKGWRD